MATKKKKEAEDSIEDKLYNIRKDIAVLTELSKRYAAELLEDMRKNGLRRSEKFKISLRQTLRITDPDTAYKWGEEHNCINVDTSKAMKLIRREFTVPAGFEVQSTEYLSTRRAGANDDADSDDGDGD